MSKRSTLAGTANADARKAEWTRVRPVFASLMLALLLAALDSTAVATALPTIVGELGDLSRLAWVIAAYMLAATVGAPIVGRVSDQLGRKRVYMMTIAVFVVGGLASGAAMSVDQLIAARALQGFGGGGIIALTQTVIADIISPRERGRYQPLVGGVFGVASIAGPLLGGVLVDHATWRLVFWMNVPLGILALVVISRRLNLTAVPGGRRIDWFGAVLLTAGVTSLLLAISWAGTVLGWTSPALLGLITGGVAALAMFVWVQRRVQEPIVPLRLFRNRVFAIGSALSGLAGIGMFGVIMFSPLLLQAGLGVTPTASGFLMMPLLVGFVVTNSLSGPLMTRWGRYKPFPIAGTIAMTAGVWWLATLGSGAPLLHVGAALATFGVGLGLVLQVVLIAVQNAVEPRDLGSATALVQFFRTVGGTTGVTLFGAVLNAHLAASSLERLGAGSLDELLHSPARMAQLATPVREVVQGAIADGITVVFAISIPFVAAGIVLSLLLPELPLGDRSGERQRASEAEPQPAPEPP